jgi:uncharacterized protein (TIGR03067 family)
MADDLEKLQGNWHVTTLELDGRDMPAEPFEGAMIVIENNNFTSLNMGGTYEGTVELDQTTEPKSFDMLFRGGHAAGTRNLGIYKLNRERWTICVATRGDARPKRFATKPDTGVALETLERSPARKSTRGKSRAQAKPVATPVEMPSIAAPQPGEVTPLEGDWAMVSAVFNGVPMATEMVKWAKRMTRGNITSVVAGPQTMLKATFTIDESKTPHTIDYMNIEGPNRGKSQAGVFELEGDTLRICMSGPGNARPRNFSSKSGDGRSFTTWLRGKNWRGAPATPLTVAANVRTLAASPDPAASRSS